MRQNLATFGEHRLRKTQMANNGSIFEISDLLRLNRLEKLYPQLFIRGYPEKLIFLGVSMQGNII